MYDRISDERTFQNVPFFFFQDLQPNLFGTSKQSDRLSVSVHRLVRLYVILEERERNKKQETRNKKQETRKK